LETTNLIRETSLKAVIKMTIGTPKKAEVEKGI
jgi:hypothetical protein